jgi:hypothetical protein
MELRRIAVATGILFAGLSPGAAWAQNGYEAAQKPCVAAKASVRWGNTLRVSPAVKAAAEQYRSGWRAACAKGGGASLAALLNQADLIAATLERELQKNPAKGKAVDAQHTALAEVFPTFLPAILGSVIEYEFVLPLLFVYKAKASLGDAQDKAFFAAHGLLFGDDFKAPPWVQRTWDYGGCARLSTYDFAAGLTTADRLRRAAARPAYLRRLTEYETRMREFFETLTGAPYNKANSLFTCDKPEAVAANLGKALASVEKRPGFGKAATSLKTVLALLKSGALTIKKGEGRQ